MAKRVKVLVIDDSLVFRETIARGIGADAGIEVVGTAADVFIARDKILALEPDVLALDVEMPKMNGIEFLKRLMPQYPLPVVVVSSVSEHVFDALAAGAVDFVTKPDGKSSQSLPAFIRELILKVKIASTAKVGPRHDLFSTPVNAMTSGDCRLIAIGASTGGTEAIYEIIHALPERMPGIVIVQHMPPVFTAMYAKRLDSACALNVKEAEAGDEIVPGQVLIAPGGERHMQVVRQQGSYRIAFSRTPKVNGHCPSVDMLFLSVAEAVGSAAIGVILTGMGYDGAKGLFEMKQFGAMTIGQDERTSVVYGMPKAAYDIGAVSRQAPLGQIPQLLVNAAAKRSS
ncbi:MAG: chemotaxis response regulator protein-glutamate methylesterase [Sporomusaceae bacterium]|nr:chemotaxis response regulator protein-glutamate methylesterase [Sporomusaceae bacterium]